MEKSSILQNKFTHYIEQHESCGTKDGVRRIFNSEDGARDVQWTSAMRRPERSVDLDPWVQGTLRYGNEKRAGQRPALFRSNAEDGT